jgi:hypothetical protein
MFDREVSRPAVSLPVSEKARATGAPTGRVTGSRTPVATPAVGRDDALGKALAASVVQRASVLQRAIGSKPVRGQLTQLEALEARVDAVQERVFDLEHPDPGNVSHGPLTDLDDAKAEAQEMAAEREKMRPIFMMPRR